MCMALWVRPDWLQVCAFLGFHKRTCVSSPTVYAEWGFNPQLLPAFAHLWWRTPAWLANDPQNEHTSSLREEQDLKKKKRCNGQKAEFSKYRTFKVDMLVSVLTPCGLVLIRVLQRNQTNRIHIYEGIYFEELACVIVGADKSHHLWSTSWRPGEVNDVVPVWVQRSENHWLLVPGQESMSQLSW